MSERGRKPRVMAEAILRRQEMAVHVDQVLRMVGADTERFHGHHDAARRILAGDETRGRWLDWSAWREEAMVDGADQYGRPLLSSLDPAALVPTAHLHPAR